MTGITDINIPSRVKKTPKQLGLDQKDPKTLLLPDGLEVAEKGWFHETEVERVVVSKSVRVLGPSLFYGCERLREVVFEPGSSLERIREQCFKGCGLEQVCLPKSVWCIEGFSFSGCKKLSQLSFEKRSKLRYVGDMAFRGTQLAPKDVKYPRSLKAKGHGSEW